MLSGKVVIVTGSGGQGSGRAIARRFAREGASVIVTDIDETGAAKTVALIESERGRATFCKADMAQESDIKHLIDFAERQFGGVDVLVNNASAPYHPETPFEHWIETIQIDLIGAVHTTLYCRDAMRQRGGAIVNIASVSALGHGRKHAEVPAYDVAKAGLIHLTTTLGRLAATENIRVNCLVPGWIATPEVQGYVDSLTPEQRAKRAVPATLITTDQIAGAVLDLATDESLAGRVLVWWNDEPPRLIRQGDQGYERLEPYTRTVKADSVRVTGR